MFTKKLVVTALFAAGLLGATAVPLAPVASADVVVKVAPPAPRAERTPAPRKGYVWSPGHYKWNGKRHVWVAGSWHKERRGYAYSPPRWEERDGRWHYHASRWDRDGDGVPNDRDRRPDNPNRQ